MILFKPWEKREWTNKCGEELSAYRRLMINSYIPMIEIAFRSDNNFRVHVRESFVKNNIIPSEFIDEYEDIELTRFDSAEAAMAAIDNILIKLGCKLLTEKELNLL
jgi:hypothetical protein